MGLEFSFKQIKDKKMYTNMKKSGHAPFERIDGKRFVVKVTPVIIEGREVLKTEPYKIDEEKSSPREPDITLENGDAQYLDKVKPIS
ncbi:hypothetical protein [Brevibacillus laterosporus]|uniref:hypothetical protein n=1 Tax=Brevibacillus laterosporus TaxID=1465 RepID=UPI00264B64EF|nr:hypothetical protein [Brevibacillus laterosporus]MDN9009518.1 hypothetical protein [Brevibacillus laterosporus]MDO0940483.1 hypothetical protein [Brevibacillus laterosporus]